MILCFFLLQIKRHKFKQEVVGISTINSISNIIINLVRVGAAFRILYLVVSALFTFEQIDETIQSTKRKATYVLLAYIICEVIFSLKDTILSYY